MLANHRVITLFLMIAAAGMSNAAWAQDFYVKPNQPTQRPVDLGLGIKPTAQPAQPHVGQPHVAQSPTAQPIQQPAPPPTQPTPIQQPRIQPQPTPQPTPPPVVQIGNAEIIPVPDQPVSISPGSGPNLFNIAILPGALGQAEASEIYKTLGLNSQESASNCVLEHMVVLSIGEAGSVLSMGQLVNAQQRFSGTISAIDIFPTIACKKIRRPVNGMVIEQGGYYKISAQNTTCPQPRAGSINLSFKYLGNGKADCQYK